MKDIYRGCLANDRSLRELYHRASVAKGDTGSRLKMEIGFMLWWELCQSCLMLRSPPVDYTRPAEKGGKCLLLNSTDSSVEIAQRSSREWF